MDFLEFWLTPLERIFPAGHSSGQSTNSESTCQSKLSAMVSLRWRFRLLYEKSNGQERIVHEAFIIAVNRCDSWVELLRSLQTMPLDFPLRDPKATSHHWRGNLSLIVSDDVARWYGRTTWFMMWLTILM